MLVPGKTDGTQVSSEMILIPLLPDLCGVQNIWYKSLSENKSLINNFSLLKDQVGESASQAAASKKSAWQRRRMGTVRDHSPHLLYLQRRHPSLQVIKPKSICHP